MRVLIGGSSGLVGRALRAHLACGGHEVVRLVRGGAAGPGERLWDPGGGRLEADTLGGIDAVVHLGGVNIAGRWTAHRKRRIADSRIGSTSLLATTMAAGRQRPGAFLCASAVGFYGDRGETRLDEASGPGPGFLADVCRRWEAAADPARDAGVRVAHLRFGIVLSGRDGALAKMLLPFRLGLGGVIGTGSQYWSWIALDDAAAAVIAVLERDGLAGAVNVTAPQPVTNRQFTKTLGRVLGRPTVLPVPGFAARLALGQMADEALLASTRAEPGRLVEAGFEFAHPELEGALREVLGKKAER